MCSMSLQEVVAVSEQITAVITGAVVVPLLIFFGAVIIGRVIRVSLAAFLRSVEFDAHAKKAMKYRADYAGLVSGGLAAIIYTVGVVWALVEAGIIVLALQAAGVFLGVIALVALVVWLVDFLPNMFAYWQVVKKWSVGDSLEVSGVSGTVQSFGWLAVTLDANGHTVVVPHRTVKRLAKKA